MPDASSPCPRCGCAALDESPATFVVCCVCGEILPATGRRANSGVTLGDRLVTALISFLFAILTAFVVLVVLLQGPEALVFTPVFGWFALLLVIVAPVTGFALGSERAASAWAAFWGRENPGPRQVALTAVFLAIVALLAFFA